MFCLLELICFKKNNLWFSIRKSWAFMTSYFTTIEICHIPISWPITGFSVHFVNQPDLLSLTCYSNTIAFLWLFFFFFFCINFTLSVLEASSMKWSVKLLCITRKGKNISIFIPPVLCSHHRRSYIYHYPLCVYIHYFLKFSQQHHEVCTITTFILHRETEPRRTEELPKSHNWQGGVGWG